MVVGYCGCSIVRDGARSRHKPSPIRSTNVLCCEELCVRTRTRRYSASSTYPYVGLSLSVSRPLRTAVRSTFPKSQSRNLRSSDPLIMKPLAPAANCPSTPICVALCTVECPPNSCPTKTARIAGEGPLSIDSRAVLSDDARREFDGAPRPGCRALTSAAIADAGLGSALPAEISGGSSRGVDV